MDTFGRSNQNSKNGEVVQSLVLALQLSSLLGWWWWWQPTVFAVQAAAWSPPRPMTTRNPSTFGPTTMVLSPRRIGWAKNFCSPRSTTKTTTLCLYRDTPHDENDEYDDDDDPPEVDVSQFRHPLSTSASSSSSISSFGYGRGRSSPNQRKAMGKSSSSLATVYLCSNCGSEFVQWRGKCPTCHQWNTLQEHAVVRDATTMTSGNGAGWPVFGPAAGPLPTSWLDGVLADASSSSSSWMPHGRPVRITDLYPQQNDDDDTGEEASSNRPRRRRERIPIPHDDEFTTVLGGGLVPGSLVLIGGDPGVGKSTLLLQMAGAIATYSSQPTPGIGMGPAKTTVSKPNHTTTNNNNHPTPLGPVWYCSGEESPEQIAARAHRLGLDSSELWLWSETVVDTLCAKVIQSLQHFEQQQQLSKKKKKKNTKKKNQWSESEQDEEDPSFLSSSSSSSFVWQALPPSVVILDSIQTMVSHSASGSAGSITQVRECVALLLRLAKSTGIPIVLVGHVTKSGTVAGPRTVEHMVDAVLYLEHYGTSSSTIHQVRLLRASKNRFGSQDAVGMYEMTTGRLRPVSDPSTLFVSSRSESEDVEGCAIAMVMEGMRAMAVEVQALVTPLTGGGGGAAAAAVGRRTVQGMAPARLLLLLGVLQKRCGLPWSLSRHHDIYVNVAVSTTEQQQDTAGRRPNNKNQHATDLATAVALVSSFVQIPVRADTVLVGEVGLLGELRPVAALDKRLVEAHRLGFSRVITPPASQQYQQQQKVPSGLQWIPCRRLYDALQAALVQPLPPLTTKRRRRTTPSSSATTRGDGRRRRRPHGGGGGAAPWGQSKQAREEESSRQSSFESSFSAGGMRSRIHKSDNNDKNDTHDDEQQQQQQQQESEDASRDFWSQLGLDGDEEYETAMDLWLDDDEDREDDDKTLGGTIDQNDKDVDEEGAFL